MKRLAIKTMLLVLSVLFIISSNSTFAESAYKINYKSAIDLMLSVNENLKTQDAKIKTAQDRYYNVCSIAVDAKYKVGKSDVENIEYRNQELLYQVQSFNALTYMKNNKDETIRSLKSDLTEKYFNLLILNKQFDLKLKTINNAKKELETAALKLKSGKITSSAYESIKNNLEIENFNLEQLRRERQNSLLGLNALLGNKLDNEIAITELDIPEVSYNVMFDSQQIDTFILENQKTDITVKRLKNELEEAKIELKNITENTNNKNYPGKEALEDIIANSTYKINNALSDVENNIRKEYNTLLNSGDDVSISSIKYDLAKKDAEIAQKKYKLGTIDYTSMTDYISQKDSSEISLLKAKLNLYMQSLEFSKYLNK